MGPSPETANKVLIPLMRQVFSRPRLANALFGRLLSKAFTVRCVAELEPKVEQVTEELVA